MTSEFVISLSDPGLSVYRVKSGEVTVAVTLAVSSRLGLRYRHPGSDLTAT